MSSLPTLRAAIVAAMILVTATSGTARAGHSTYIALGDSLAFGTGGDQSSADVSNGDRGYVGAFADVLAARNGGARPNLFNLGVFGETSSSFFQGDPGGQPGSPSRNTNYPNPAVSQNALLLSTIASEQAAGDTISTVSIQLGANDLYAVAGSPGFFGLTPGQQQALILQALGTVQANDAALLTELRTMLPTAQLILMGYYDPYGAFYNDPSSPFYAIAQASHVAIPALDQLIAGEASAFGAVYVDDYTPFVGNELAYTYVAAGGNVHPNSTGYAVITAKLAAATVPEPASAALLAAGLVPAGLAAVRRRRPRRDPQM